MAASSLGAFIAYRALEGLFTWLAFRWLGNPAPGTYPNTYGIRLEPLDRTETRAAVAFEAGIALGSVQPAVAELDTLPAGDYEPSVER